MVELYLTPRNPVMDSLSVFSRGQFVSLPGLEERCVYIENIVMFLWFLLLPFIFQVYNLMFGLNIWSTAY